jgi:multidrug efflux pump subunit AcrA (membrane-fusion protein)
MNRNLLPVVLLFVLSCNNKEAGIQPVIEDITESVYASVTIQPDSIYQSFAEVSGIVEDVMVQEGDLIDADKPIVRIRNVTPELNLENARLAFQQARADLFESNGALADLESQIRTARLQMKDDSINYIRQRRLWEQNIGSKAEFEKRRLAYDLAVNRLNNLESTYNKLKRDLQINYQQAENNYRMARVNKDDYTIRSRIKGRVYSVEKEVGEKVSLQEPVATIGSAVHFIIEMRIDERDIALIKKDQIILLTLEAYDGQVFRGEVARIFPQKNERNQTFKVEGEFITSPGSLYAGLSGEANIMIQQKKDALTIPLEYLTSDSQVLTDDGLVPVSTGIRSLDKVEILDGISENTRIYLPEK